MVRGRRQNPDAPPSRQLEISRAFRQRKASDLQDLRERADRLERENIELRQECERLRGMVRRSSYAVSSSNESTNEPSSSIHHFSSSSQQLTPSERMYNQNEIVVNRLDDRIKVPITPHSTTTTNDAYRRDSDLISNFDENWPSVQAQLDRYSHTENTMTNSHHPHQQQQLNAPVSNIPTQSVYGYEGHNNGQQPQQHLSPPVLRLQTEMQNFGSPQLRSGNEAQMRGINQMTSRNDANNLLASPNTPITNVTHPTNNHHHHNHHQMHPISHPHQQHQDDQVSAQRLWDFSVPRTTTTTNLSIDETKCCGGIFECDESGQIKVETPPHIAYPA